MLKRIFCVLLLVCITAVMTVGAFAAYPSSGKIPPEGSVLLEGKIIGEKIGWDGTENTGRAAACDGNIYTYYDPTQGMDDNCYVGIKLSEKYVLTMACIMPRDGQLARYDGGMIQGSDDGKNWTTLWQSKSAVDEFEWQVIKKFKNNVGYTYYRYWNDRNHGDVAEVELYGYAGTSDGISTLSTPIVSVKIAFDTMGGDGKPSEIEAVFGGTYPSLDCTTEKEGYTFDGWYTAPVNGVKVDEGSRITSPTDITLYAHWTEISEISEDNVVSSEDEVHTEESGGFTNIQCIAMTGALIFVLFAVVAVVTKKTAKK